MALLCCLLIIMKSNTRNHLVHLLVVVTMSLFKNNPAMTMEINAL